MDSKKSEYLKSIKDDIKAIVVSSKSQMTVNDLFREYYNIVGKRLSATEFGYKNVQDFLQTECTDILKVWSPLPVLSLCAFYSCQSFCQIHTLRGVPTLCPILKTESGKILNSLILNQKQSKGPMYLCFCNTFLIYFSDLIYIACFLFSTPRKSIITRQTITQNRNVSQNQIKPNFNKPNPTTSLLTGNINKLTLTRKNNESNSTTPPTNKFNGIYLT